MNDKFHIRCCSNEVIQTVLEDGFIGVLTANSIEFNSVYNLIEPFYGLDYIISGAIESNKLFFGVLGCAPICLIKLKDQGSVKKNASLNILHELSEKLPLKSVLAVGNCFLINDSLELGDVVISTSIYPCDTNKIENGVRSKVKPIKSQKFNSFIGLSDVSKILEEFEFNIKTGPIVSTETLVDCERYKSDLVKTYSDVLAGEMEGTGVASFCSKKK